MEDHPHTEAMYLHDRIRFAGTLPATDAFSRIDQFELPSGQSVYWQKIFKVSPDPTFIFLTFIWHALYAWDEALQDLYKHICQMVCPFHLLVSSELSPLTECIRNHMWSAHMTCGSHRSCILYVLTSCITPPFLRTSVRRSSLCVIQRAHIWRHSQKKYRIRVPGC